MIINKIIVKNFKNFKGQHSFDFEKMNFIKGINGSGKTTLALESILFAIYGYTPKDSLKDLPTKNESMSCSVIIELEHSGHQYKIERHYPTKLTIEEDGKILTFVTSTESQKYLNNLFGDTTYFKKFRIVDAYNKESNFLEEGPIALKKIILSLSEELFNNARTKLNQIKHDRELLNKDSVVVYPYYKSEKRLQILTDGKKKLESDYTEINNILRNLRKEYNQLSNELSRYKENIRYLTEQKEKTLNNEKCYVCGQDISENTLKSIITEIELKIEKTTLEMPKIIESLKDQEEIICSQEHICSQISEHLTKVNELKLKLYTCLQYKKYIYTEKDVLIVKKAIEELDKLSTYYMVESIKILEPIINSVLEKIEFRVSFTINEKSVFTITLQKNGVEYKYNDLSCGQKLLLQIAFKLALLLEKNETGLIVADEGLGALDENNLLHIIEIFRNLPFQLFLVLHNAPDLDNIKTIELK